MILGTMEDAEEIDILGDFDYKTSAMIPEEDSELPSNSVQLLPEFSRHPWLLEQEWSLDHCTDERNRAVIEKMLLEEQSYTDGMNNKSEPIASAKSAIKPLSSKTDKKITPHRKSSWNDEERSLFFQGYSLYGRRWSKIAELIPSKTHQQVKNYALHHLRNKKAVAEEAKDQRGSRTTQSPSSLDGSECAVLCSDGQLSYLSKLKGFHNIKLPEVIRIKKKSESDSDSDIDIEMTSDDEGVVQGSVMNDVQVSGISSDVLSTSSSTLLSDASLCCVNESKHIDDISDEKSPALKTLISDESVDCSNCSANICDQSKDSNISTKLGVSDLVNNLDTSDNLTNKCHDKHTTESPFACEIKVSSDVSTDVDVEDASASGCNIHMNSVHQHLETEKFYDVQIENKADVATQISTMGTTDENFLPAVDEEDSELHPDECAVLCSDGQLVYLSNPKCEVVILPQDISDQERMIHAEFFIGKNNTKTPQRYLKIRNHIIECWKRNKPAYLKKTAVRNGLKNCGDVNCIGRIHSYLEQIGAINFGCEQAQYNNPMRHIQPKSTKELQTKEVKERVKVVRLESMRPRKRRMRDIFGHWINSKNMEGRTIEHTENEAREQLPTKQHTSVRKYNPFQLIPCKKYNEEHPAPYSVTITTTALVIMDTHAHLAKTEVIGLLGGQYNGESSKLIIMTAEPCDSLSTSMQCEMDPVSQTQACERLQVKGQSVVGWYHSHPLFDAYPSLRDIETQNDFQNWFATGGNAFVGIIISPYNRNCFSLVSDIRCLVVEAKDNQTAVPYEFAYQVVHRNFNLDDVVNMVKKLADLYTGCPNRVLLSHKYKSHESITCLDKLLHSVRRHFNDTDCTEDDDKILVQKLKENMQHILKE